jgi:hypothetical protein
VAIPDEGVVLDPQVHRNNLSEDRVARWDARGLVPIR